MKCVFSLDDFCYELGPNCVPYLLELDDYFFNFKISFFTVPCYEGTPMTRYKEWYQTLPLTCEHILHGYFHTRHEFEHLDQVQCEHFLLEGMKLFQKCDFPIIKGFKAPNWRYNINLVRALKRFNFWLATYTPGHNNPEVICYNWNWDIGEPIPDMDVLHAHGHTHNVSGPGKGVEVAMKNILSLPQDTEFYFISEVMDGKV